MRLFKIIIPTLMLIFFSTSLNTYASKVFIPCDNCLNSLFFNDFEQIFNPFIREEPSDNQWSLFEESFSVGDGLSENTAFQIETEEQLAFLSAQINQLSSQNYYYYELVNDLDLSDYYWSPIGTESYKFYGCFNGNDHTISGIKINNPEEPGQGLFGYVKKDSQIKNLNIQDFQISGDFFVGGIVGSGPNITVENCNASNGTVESQFNYAGGIIGDATKSTVTNCHTNSVTVSGQYLVGALFGNQDNVKVHKCSNNFVVIKDLSDDSY